MMMRLLRGIWKLLVGIKDALVLLFMLMFFGILYAALSMAPKPAATTGSGALVVDLDGSLVEQPENVNPVALVSQRDSVGGQYRLRDLVRALRAAAADGNVKAVVLDLDRFTGGGQATISDAAGAVDEVRRAGKPVFAYATGYNDDAYQLAAHASEIWLDPVGAVMLTGPGGSQLYYKGFLDKIGVSTHVYKVGKFKSAVEPFIRNDQSPEAREANQVLADSLWGSWKSDVSKVRPKAKLADYITAPDRFIGTANGSISGAALAAGMVDRLGDRIAFGKRVAKVAGEANKSAGFKAIDYDSYVDSHPESTSGDAVGVLTIAGEIVDGEAGPGTAAGDTISALLAEELTRNRIKALVVRVDSPGGSVTAAERIRNQILAAKAQGLPVVVSMGSVAASGGYWVSTPASKIYAEPSTITGSIGVFGIIPTFKGTLDKLGLSADGVKTTPLSGEPNVLNGTSPEFDKLVQLGIDDVYRRFTELVAQSRHLPIARVYEIAEGRVWAGGTARQIGLVDAFGSLDDAIAEAGRLAKLDPKNVRALFIEREPNRFEKFLRDAARSGRDNGSEARDPWSMAAKQPQRAIEQAIHDARSVLMGPAMQVRCLECGGLGASSRVTADDRGFMQLLIAKMGL